MKKSRTKRCRRASAVWLVFPALLLLPSLFGRSITEADRQHWAFQPLKRVQPPQAEGTSEVKNPIDRFILFQLHTNHLQLAPRAGKEQLIRRVGFDLVGLPPTIKQIEVFINDSSPRAYEELVDRLLASPHYGERWGRHWLDLARFAESDGFEHDAVRPHSWRYRDYVIKSFNAEKPYDGFIREQLAGDELFPHDPDALIATGFNLLGPDMVDSADQVQRRHNTLNDMTDTAALVFLGQTIGCARCHNHKSEPFSQRDYYQLQAFFSRTKFERELPVPTPAERSAHEADMAKYDALTQSLRNQIEAIESPYREQIYAAKLAKLSEEARLAHQTPKEKRTVEMENQIQETAELLKISDAELLKKMSADDKTKRNALLDQLKKFPKPSSLPLAMALQDSGASSKTFILARGDYNNPGDAVEPAFPEILCASRANDALTISDASQRGLPLPQGEGRGEGEEHTDATKVSRIEYDAAKSNAPPRARLANWIASPENPLSARVMVNRIWQHHFGRGIVPSPSEFGTRAEPPTHPELLDWLANEFIASGWSIKKMHKLILLSEAYQQSTEASAESLTRDPENKLFSRQNRQRLEGEVIRDSLLAISGELNPKVGGPSVFPPIPGDIAKSVNWTPSAQDSDHSRRSLYIFARRNLRFPFLEVFDAPDNNLSCPQRGRSTTAPQSLTLLNSEQVMAAAKATADRILRERATRSPSPGGEGRGEGGLSAQVKGFPISIEDQIHYAFHLVIGRSPSDTERALARDFINSCSSRREEAPTFDAKNDQPLQALCRALFNINAFVYVE